MSVCFEWQDKGTCKFGDTCRFPHGANGVVASFNGPGVCHSWRDGQGCTYGDNCRFSHGGSSSGGAAAPQRSGPPQEGVDGNWRCLKCDNINYARREVCNRCGEAPSRQGGGYNNYPPPARSFAPPPPAYGGGPGGPGFGGPGYGPPGGERGYVTTYGDRYSAPANYGRYPPHVEQLGRGFLDAFARDPDPVNSAIKCLLSLDGGAGARPYGEGMGGKRRRVMPG
eukprot:CAMPEP_0205830888 /NCGR_PEP_ID=MMETSP0206-20130828/42425_1 /ASSEMBLY_ACC=CAM_ASM_000279 /TAXON_ID=36767 /ORGANISM="Euplotes focardii, Strain TN1" /LENGTH=224 /DNA_ID=CAMNT_0053134965 /DNA_START=20 /DNA_END=690 /DNA_ORIENTATION=-